jgi:hypothetical protein
MTANGRRGSDVRNSCHPRCSAAWKRTAAAAAGQSPARTHSGTGGNGCARDAQAAIDVMAACGQHDTVPAASR